LIEEKLGWNYEMPLREGMEKTYKWIAKQIENNEEVGYVYDDGVLSSRTIK